MSKEKRYKDLVEAYWKAYPEAVPRGTSRMKSC